MCRSDARGGGPLRVWAPSSPLHPGCRASLQVQAAPLRGLPQLPKRALKVQASADVPVVAAASVPAPEVGARHVLLGGPCLPIV